MKKAEESAKINGEMANVAYAKWLMASGANTKLWRNGSIMAA
jgi:hypothetical protein